MAQPADLQALIDKWEHEVEGYLCGSMLASPVGDMNRASAVVVRQMLADLSRLGIASPSPASHPPTCWCGQPAWSHIHECVPGQVVHLSDGRVRHAFGHPEPTAGPASHTPPCNCAASRVLHEKTCASLSPASHPQEHP